MRLVGNAIKFTDRGEVILRVEAVSQTAGRVCLHFAVADTGIGIPAEKQNVIFNAFEQADGSTTRRYGGSGLGLAMCSGLIQTLDGRIWVGSEVGRGSTFHFTVPFGLSAAPALPEHVPAAAPLPRVRARRRSTAAPPTRPRQRVGRRSSRIRIPQ